MLRPAIRIAGRYQHVAFAHGSLCARSTRSFASAAACLLKFGGPNDQVTIFEQDTLSSKKRRLVDPEAEDLADQKEVEAELARLDRELRILKEGPLGRESPFMRDLPEKDREIALEVLRKYEEEHGPEEDDVGLEVVFDKEFDEMLREEFEGFAREELEELLPKTAELAALSGRMSSLSQSQQPGGTAATEPKPRHVFLDRFDKCLAQYSKDTLLHAKLGEELWRWYRRCKQVDPQFIHSLPETSAALVWESQTRLQTTHAVREAHLRVLVEDAAAAGRALSTPQILSYIQALQENGETKTALDQWEAHQTALSEQRGDLEAYWKLGVQLFAAECDPQRAQDIALAFLANDPAREPRVLIPVILAWARQSSTKTSETKAWAIYLQLRAFLGNKMTMEDYDSISIGLLKAGRLNLALAVFKDMMVTGSDPANDSTALYKAALGLAGNLHATSVTEDDVNKVSLKALTILPRRLQNRFFYASWMKKLIGMREVDSAASVIELMYERGIRPDAKHLNGIIAAWLREGNAAARDKAERLGWAMIQQKIDKAWEHGQPDFAAGSTKPMVAAAMAQRTQGGRPVPKFMQRAVPLANIETFSILLLHYTRRGDDDMAKYLTKCLGDARIQPNSYIINHLLYAELRRQDIHALWQKFQAMKAMSIRPDLETFACLWDCAKIQYDPGRTAFDPDFPTARSLFADMLHWLHTQPSERGRATAQGEFSKDLYDQIVRCFCLSRDLHGTLVALFVLRDIFGFYPDETTARTVILQIARMAGVPTGTPRRRLRRLSTMPRSKENIAHVEQLVELLSTRRAAALRDQGLDPENLDPVEKQHNQLGLLADLLRIVLARMSATPDSVEGQISAAAAEMGAAETTANLGQPLGDDSSLV